MNAKRIAGWILILVAMYFFAKPDRYFAGVFCIIMATIMTGSACALFKEYGRDLGRERGYEEGEKAGKGRPREIFNLIERMNRWGGIIFVEIDGIITMEGEHFVRMGQHCANSVTEFAIYSIPREWEPRTGLMALTKAGGEPKLMPAKVGPLGLPQI
ncbi:MAG: hypothetical protein WCV92_01105 [Candidatus Buchananbacteria bacterium]